MHVRPMTHALAPLALALAVVAGCDKQPKESPASPAASVPAASSAAARAEPGPRVGATRFRVGEGSVATFLIDAPLEKIKGRSRVVRGFLDVDPSDVKGTTGQIELDLDALATETFDDAEKNAKQSEHAHNWLEIGNEVPKAARDDHRYARFVLASVDAAEPGASLAAVAGTGAERVVTITARGTLRLHGVDSPKVVHVRVAFQGEPAHPSSLAISTVEPLAVSLREHDVKPRDLAGRFLDGALEKVGKKIDDRVAVTLDLRAAPAR